ncbi:hypothetical protein MRB53_042377 [Persea americana]|nr:hypothetical protein MRB53_042377 [Persea americana]
MRHNQRRARRLESETGLRQRMRSSNVSDPVMNTASNVHHSITRPLLSHSQCSSTLNQHLLLDIDRNSAASSQADSRERHNVSLQEPLLRIMSCNAGRDNFCSCI